MVERLDMVSFLGGAGRRDCRPGWFILDWRNSKIWPQEPQGAPVLQKSNRRSFENLRCLLL